MQRSRQLSLVGHGNLRRRRRGGSPRVGHEVGDGEVGLVAHAGDHGQTRRVDGPRHPLIIEGPQFFQRSAAPRDDDSLCFRVLIEGFNSGHDLQRRLVPLHQGRGENHFQQGVATPQDVQYIPESSARRRGDYAQAAGKGRQGPLALRVEEALGLQAFLEGLKLEVQSPQTSRLEVVYVELISALNLVDGDASVSKDGFAVGGEVALPCGHRAPHHAADAGSFIFQGEVGVPRR